MKQTKKAEKSEYEDIHMPKNTALGLYIGGFSFLLGFAIIWHIVWMSVLGALGLVACLIARVCDRNTETYISVEEVKRIENERLS